jgi:4-alpha-glucanotransferase
MLPVCPPGHGYSPYDSPSSFAISSALLSIEFLAQTGLLDVSEVPSAEPATDRRRADFAAAEAAKQHALRLAHERFASRASSDTRAAFEAFKSRSRGWLDDHALFMALKWKYDGLCWTSWVPELRDRQPAALMLVREELRTEIEFHEFAQFELSRQWELLKGHCRSEGVLLIGDVPIYVSHDSADVWANRNVFCLDPNGEREVVAGVPPDYFSETGQLWGNPLYHWPTLSRTRFAWWIARLRTCLERFDAVRLDHFIGFHRYWEVSATATTAQQGRYVDVPGEKFFAKVFKEFGSLPFIAEDLGVVTPEVTKLRQRFNLPGMKILQFAFDDPSGSDYLPHRYETNTAVYTGTHDNDTSAGWFHAPAPWDDHGRQHHEGVRERIRRYLGGDPEPIHWRLIQLALGSVATTAIVPVQDLLGLGSEARMNTPGTTNDNWSFRLKPEELTEAIAAKLRAMCEAYER